MNVYDSDRMADLVNNNYSLVKTPEDCRCNIIKYLPYKRERLQKKFILKLENIPI